ncbi:MAG: hypothetical protein D6682_03825 [Zetaproteobacteria bacterium]|nr:MAG: hypothetical protein D6682_03825 [Zetaproteobacteria bacterium]
MPPLPRALPCLLFCALAWPMAVGANPPSFADQRLLLQPLDRLINLPVRSALKRDQRYFDVASAIYVITAEEIRHAGARSIPEALRLAPGVEVQQINANQYAISIRGHNTMFAKKLLVLMDGRPLYSPTFSGTWWLVQHYPMADIERIEVLRGPSGAVWGSNAANGIINIITRSAHDTQGARVTGGFGNEERGFATLRYGGATAHSDWRIYLMRENRDGGAIDKQKPISDTIFALNNPTDTARFGSRAPDSRQLLQGGLRIDADAGARDHFTLHGDRYRVDAGSFFYEAVPGAPPRNNLHRNHYRGDNLMLDWNHRLGADGKDRVALRLFRDLTEMQTRFFGERRTTFDGELQIDTTLLPRTLLSLGYSHRNSRSRVTDSDIFHLPDATTRIDSWFLNGEITLLPRRWRLILGLKNERNQYSGWELQPHIRTIWQAARWSLWGAWSKGVRIPNRIENGMRFDVNSGPGYTVRAIGDGRTRSEQVFAWEAGVRLHPDDRTLLQATAFWMRYPNLSDTVTDRVSAWLDPAGYQVIPVYLGNYLRARSHGIEADFQWQASDRLTLEGSYSYLHQNVTPTAGGSAFAAATYAQQSPEGRYHLAARLRPTETTALDLDLYHWGRFRQNLSTGQYKVPAHSRIDGRIAWQATPQLSVELIGHNLLHRRHIENQSELLEYASLVERSLFARITWEE